MALRVLDHPVASHLLTLLRDESTEPSRFRTLCDRLTSLLIIEATRDLPTNSRRVKTPLEETEGMDVACPIVVVPILRAGLAMLQSAVELLPAVSVGYVGMERDEKTAEPHAYYCKLPPVKGSRVLVVDPMLATGGSALAAIERVQQEGAEDITMVSIVASPEGVARLEESLPGLSIVTASLDRQLDARKYILPGLGDFGDRLYGT